MADEQEISQLEELRNSAVDSVAADGIRVDFNQEVAAQRLAELKQAAAETTWPRTAPIRLSSGFPE